MARKFMFVCIGILALAVTFHLGAQYGHAYYVDHSTTGILSVAEYEWQIGYQYTNVYLLDNGQVWRLNGPAGGWVLSGTMPVPASDIKFFGYNWFVTTANELWINGTNYGSPPGTVSAQPSTWGQIKGQFRK